MTPLGALPFRVQKKKREKEREKTGNETCAGSGLGLVQDGSQSGACCSFAKTENEIHEEKWSELAWEPDDSWHRVAAETLTGLENWNVMVPLLVETARTPRAQIASVEKEDSRATTRKVRAELALLRSMEEKTSLETRGASGKDQGERRDGESSQENAKHASQLDFDCKTRKPRNCSHKLLPRPLLDSRRPGGSNPIRETSLGRAVEKPENGRCRRNVDLTEETGERSEEIEKWERFNGSNHSETSVCRSLRLLKTGVLKQGMTDFFHLGELIPRPKTKKGANEPMRARAMHMMVVNTWMNPNTEQEFCTALVSQLCQDLSGYNCVNVGLELLDSDANGLQGSWSDAGHLVCAGVCAPRTNGTARRAVLSVGDWFPRLALNDVQLDCEFEFESVELERDGTGRRFDRPCSDADSDAHAVVYILIIGVDDGVHELFTPRKLRCPARLRSQNCWRAR